ncbi:hypothetical protein CKAN_00800800 [Cinnamomum micranthum f. kanehirae]|uniref:Uncharacterized protein n=1 Tax=Cinnamomum micranthum f. kanehirae TaxID=337451 RepID=A0A443NLS5_9MAGN|nr:hypothetical protein CKAN_00800800 [Cinnamomum micranthum f. kanehirae]
MKKSAAVSTQENGEAWDPQEHFSMFLEEAKRRHERKTEQEEAAASYSSPSTIQQAKDVGRSEEEEKKKKKINNNKNSRWKGTLFFWRKSEKKMKPKHELLTPTPTRESPHKNTSFRHVFSKATSGRRAVSGPIDAGGEQVCHLKRWNSYRASNTSRDAEIQISYTLLDQLNQPRKMDGAFGPIYLVT